MAGAGIADSPLNLSRGVFYSQVTNNINSLPVTNTIVSGNGTSNGMNTFEQHFFSDPSSAGANSNNNNGQQQQQQAGNESELIFCFLLLLFVFYCHSFRE